MEKIQGKAKKLKRTRFPRREKREFEQKMIDLARVTRVVKGGRRFSFRAAVVIGNRKGKVGFGVAKGTDVSTAIGKAVVEAKKSLITVKRTNTTIAFDLEEKYGAARVMLKPAREGRGIVAGGAMRTVIELAGIKDVVAKSRGASNKINVAKATLRALAKLGEPLIGEKKEEPEQKNDKKDKGEEKEKNEKGGTEKKLKLAKKDAEPQPNPEEGSAKQNNN